MRAVVGLRAVAAVAAVVLAGCLPDDSGYVEIRTVPANAARPAVLYLDTIKLDPAQKGAAVLKQRTGNAKLFVEAAGGQVPICDITVRKNRITTVTVSVLERPPRCQCQNTGANKACVS